MSSKAASVDQWGDSLSVGLSRVGDVQFARGVLWHRFIKLVASVDMRIKY